MWYYLSKSPIPNLILYVLHIFVLFPTLLQVFYPLKTLPLTNRHYSLLLSLVLLLGTKGESGNFSITITFNPCWFSSFACFLSSAFRSIKACHFLLYNGILYVTMAGLSLLVRPPTSRLSATADFNS